LAPRGSWRRCWCSSTSAWPRPEGPSLSRSLPTPLRWISEFEPLRQILAGTRSILYFDARADAGLARGVLAASLGLLFWIVTGAAVTRWYDRRGFHRLSPAELAYIGDAVRNYRAGTGEPEAAASPPADEPGTTGSAPAGAPTARTSPDGVANRSASSGG
jgi:hypothetical protein